MAIFVMPYEIGGQTEYYPSPMAFDLIFYTALAVVVAQAVLVVIFRRSATRIVTSQVKGGAAAA